jgi:hypothetical protein
MSKARKALALSASDWVLVTKAWMWFGAIEVGLSCVPIQNLLRIIQRQTKLRTSPREKEPPRPTPERVAYCVGLAARMHVLDSTCLKKALVLYALLTRQGFDAQLLIGAAKAAKDCLDAHAWLECQGKVLMGDTSHGHYATLCSLGSTPRGTQPHAQATS